MHTSEYLNKDQNSQKQQSLYCAPAQHTSVQKFDFELLL